MIGTIETSSSCINVRADGDDGSNGRSEDTPFKTLKKTVEAAEAGVIKAITVIGKIEDNFPLGEIRYSGSDELLITGKPDAAEQEKAVIETSSSYYNDIWGKIRFTFVSIQIRKNEKWYTYYIRQCNNQ